MKERCRQKLFLKNLDLVPNTNSRSKTDQKNENSISEQFCFYYFDDDAHVICRGCYKRFETWLKYRIHFNTILCYSTKRNYKLNTYNDVYKKYKLRKTKPGKKMYDCVEFMDLETLNTRKTRRKCYNNAGVVANVSKSSSDSGSSISEITVMTNEEAFENFFRSYVSIEEAKSKVTDSKTVQVQDIPNSTKAVISNPPHDNRTTLTLKTEWNTDDISQTCSDDQSSSSIHCLPNSEKRVKMKKEAYENFANRDESIEEAKPKVTDNKIVQVQNIPNGTKAVISNIPHENQTTLTIKIEWKSHNTSQASSDKQSSSSAHCLPKYKDKGTKPVQFKYKNIHYVCVICEEQFMCKSLLTMHQVQHIRSDRSCYKVFMAALGRSA